MTPPGLYTDFILFVLLGTTSTSVWKWISAIHACEGVLVKTRKKEREESEHLEEVLLSLSLSLHDQALNSQINEKGERIGGKRRRLRNKSQGKKERTIMIDLAD